MDETKFDWVDDGDGTLSARYGSLFFMVIPHADDQWTARVSVKGVTIYDESFDGRDAAIRWCGRRLPEIVDPLVATARAEAALAEREALLREIARREPGSTVFGTVASTADYINDFVADELQRLRAWVVDRTTPATLSTETLAAIAEARGLRVVEPELLEGLEPPVLRWDIDEHSTARVGPWSLEASALGWSVYVESPLTGRELIADECTDRVERSVNRRAAEAALRSLGVAFRVEDGGAL